MKRYQWKKWFIGAISAVMAFGSMAYASSEAGSESDSKAASTQEQSEKESKETSSESDSKVARPQDIVEIEWEDEWIIPDGISISQIDLGGMTVADAKKKINEFADQFLNREISIDMNGKEYKTKAKDIGVTWENPEVTDEAFDHMTKGNFVRRYKNQVDLKTNPVTLDVKIAVNEEAVAAYAQNLVNECTVQVLEPSVTRANGAFQVVEGKTGIAFNLDEIKNALVTPLKDTTNADAVAIKPTITETQPQLAPDTFSHFSEQPLGSCTTRFNTAPTEANRCKNIEISANNMNGHIFMPGEEISTLAMFGDVTQANGYTMAGTYANGQVVDGIGGGICQTTTTLYDAVLAAELEVVYRRNHSMLVDYVDPAKDATVDYPSGSDFKFKNNTNYPIYIESYRNNDTVTVNIYGTETRPANRKVEYVSNILEYSFPEANAPYFDIRVDPNMKMGWGYPQEKNRVSVNCHPQVQAELYKNVYVDGQLTEHTKIGGLNKYRYSSGILYVPRDTQARIVDPAPGTTKQRVLNIYLTFLDGENVTPQPPADWSPERIAQHEAAVAQKMKELGR